MFEIPFFAAIALAALPVLVVADLVTEPGEAARRWCRTFFPPPKDRTPSARAGQV